uniref:Uncharacterized protein n=3 Tax=Cycas TaxID=3395 RepID=A6H5N6_CYCTA|nr:hypothetical protein CYtaCp095 [Cycas taitungensis]YP_001312278.1 hypothetical protein CYtaCp113 [Cycas taitungensis]YP_007474601.1 hypothetical_protein [Cycas revoluta]YP_007474691.1 hypothetical_protein [Cycas revoluta]YP_009308171.1 hypothetical protein [Cycas panzhihuaensis]YP_009308261.1 hypothetical protein [Cycas panzhihuaensis]AEX99151.1 hypothetical_protein [Cycas revoluta]AEX99240.1 hypothetical_protein [Cycas revoluta]AOS53120.1 hypothetical protein [Cycas panzhihuaensis]AOS5
MLRNVLLLLILCPSLAAMRKSYRRSNTNMLVNTRRTIRKSRAMYHSISAKDPHLCEDQVP